MDGNFSAVFRENFGTFRVRVDFDFQAILDRVFGQSVFGFHL